jgi:hypothetical protein
MNNIKKQIIYITLVAYCMETIHIIELAYLNLAAMEIHLCSVVTPPYRPSPTHFIFATAVVCRNKYSKPNTANTALNPLLGSLCQKPVINMLVKIYVAYFLKTYE